MLEVVGSKLTTEIRLSGGVHCAGRSVGWRLSGGVHCAGRSVGRRLSGGVHWAGRLLFLKSGGSHKHKVEAESSGAAAQSSERATNPAGAQALASASTYPVITETSAGLETPN
ncbi:uncharacterized [Tachysurus ichikawai]